MKTRIGRQGRPRRDDLRGVADQIARITSGYDLGGLRVKWELLPDDDAAELVGLTRRADGPEGFNLSRRAPKERRRFEQLVEAGAEADGLFEQLREHAELRA